MNITVAARFEFLDLLQGFEATGDDIIVRTDKGEISLHAACESGQAAILQYLCEHGAPLDLEDNSRNNALHMAVSNGYLDVTGEEVNYSANVNKEDNKCATPLNTAALKGHVDIL
jgi:ankyrin repeat protein